MTLIKNLRFGVRMLTVRPGFSLVAINEIGRAYFGIQTFRGPLKLNLENAQALTGSSLPETEAYLERLLGNYRGVVEARTQLATETDYLTDLCLPIREEPRG